MTAIIIVLILSGINSYRKIGLDNMPEIDIPYVTIKTFYPGANPEEIEIDVAKPIEDAVSNIDGLKHMNSICMDGACITTLEFNLGVNKDVAAVDVRENIDLIIDDFPEGVESPRILKFDVNAQPIITLLLTGDKPLDRLYDYADEKLSDRLSVIRGVANVEISGGDELELHITLNKNKLTSIGLNTANIVNELALNNIKIPSGTIKTDSRELSVTFDGEFNNIDEIKNFEIAQTDNGTVYLRDIANISMCSKEKRTAAYYNGKPAVNLKIIKKGEANAVRVTERVKKVIREIRNKNLLPSGMQLVWFTDNADFIQASVDDAWGSVILGILLTALILFIFLHEVRSTFIVVLTMPASIIVTFAIIYFFGYTFNNSTLLALGTSVGILVTNSIVVIENIIKKLHSGSTSETASADGTGEVALPVFASATTNVVVFVPIALMSSLVGRYFIPFAVTMTAATLVSLFISFTMTPILASYFLKSKMPDHKFLMKSYTKYWNIYYTKFENCYSSSLMKLSKYPWITVSAVFLVLILTLAFLAPKVGMSFFPDNDRGEFIVKIEYPSYYNIDSNISRTLKFDERIRKLPEVISTSTVMGKIQGVLGKVSEGVHLAEITVKTTDKISRDKDMEQIKSMLRNEFKNETDCIINVGVPTVVGGSSSDIEFEILGPDLAVLEDLGRKITAEAENSPKLIDVDNNIRSEKPQIKVRPKRRIIKDMGLNSQLIGKVLRGNIEGMEVGNYKIGDRSFDIRVELKEEKGLSQLKEFTLLSKNGKPLGLETVANFKDDSIPLQISRDSKTRIVKIFADPASGIAMGDAMNFIKKKTAKILPAGYYMKFTGKAEKMGEAQLDFLEAIITAAVLTYLLISAVLESWAQPLIILLTLPLALIGLFTALYIAGIPLSMMGLLGVVMLIGIVVNNAILIMDNVIALRKEGIEPKEAMLISAKEKLRPIVMTSIAAMLGIAPMAFSSGLGSELRSSCGIAVIGGLISSTVLSLYIIPLIYIQFSKFGKSKTKNPIKEKLQN
ncbi:MAG: efflux RND transporter permease subunit [Victivallales bacterium]|nr:efflux RND transporter permease subunit [Victivallales bacterium]